MSLLLDNPIIRREGLPRWLRRLGGTRLALLIVAACLLSALTGALLVKTNILSNNPNNHFIFSSAGDFSMVWGVLAFLAMPIFAVQSIAKERARRTWEALLLSRLSARYIVLSKLAAVLLPLWLMGLVLLPCVLFLNSVSINPLAILFGYGLGTIGGLFGALVGMVLSLHCARQDHAILATYAIVIPAILLALAFLALPGSYLMFMCAFAWPLVELDSKIKNSEERTQ